MQSKYRYSIAYDALLMKLTAFQDYDWSIIVDIDYNTFIKRLNLSNQAHQFTNTLQLAANEYSTDKSGIKKKIGAFDINHYNTLYSIIKHAFYLSLSSLIRIVYNKQ